ncbi:UNVERIFIED_CONTAM: hypothetical protein HDU68_012074 [Siphonaria sp. JEL0065]|nr:hypothetical protein HDU68_012074 [Siphonaria sp. JEL0065]
MTIFANTNKKVVRINGPPARLFAILKRPEHWPVWDFDLKNVTLKDKAAAERNLEGATGHLTMTNGNTFEFTIRNVIENQQVEYLTKLPGGTDADWYWKFSPVDETAQAVDLEMGVRITGSTSFLWNLMFAPFLPKAFDVIGKNLKSLAEEGKVGGKDVSALYE